MHATDFISIPCSDISLIVMFLLCYIYRASDCFFLTERTTQFDFMNKSIYIFFISILFSDVEASTSVHLICLGDLSLSLSHKLKLQMELMENHFFKNTPRFMAVKITKSLALIQSVCYNNIKFNQITKSCY